jgi:hypothetical protein
METWKAALGLDEARKDVEKRTLREVVTMGFILLLTKNIFINW